MKIRCLTFFLLMMFSCKKTLKIPFEINKKLLVSEHCKLIGYSINRDRFFAPELISGSFDSINYKEPTRIEIGSERSAYLQSISCDCKKVASLVETTNNNGYYLVNSDLQTGHNESFEEEGGVTSSAFSPKETLLAYISISNIKVYDYTNHKDLALGKTDIGFRSLVWSMDGLKLFLEDVESNIWVYNMRERTYRELVHAQSYFWGNRNIISDKQNPDVFYYLSDTDTGFNDIYIFDKHQGSSLFYKSPYDKYLLNFPQDKNNFYFRSVENGNVFIKKFDSKGVGYATGKGVYYDYYKSSSGLVFSLYATIKHPTNIGLWKDGKALYSGLNNVVGKEIFPIPDKNVEGMVNFIYKPKGKIKAWAVYLHGGPWEQNQERYNTYINSLVEKGIGLIVLNYLGSTGIGNSYESRDDVHLLKSQILNVNRDLIKIRAKYRIPLKVSMIGISYGAKIAHGYAAAYLTEVNNVVDLSGTQDVFINYPAKRLFIYGDRDFMMANLDRVAMLKKAGLLKSTHMEVYKDETHYITQRKNIIKTIELISDFIIN